MKKQNFTNLYYLLALTLPISRAMISFLVNLIPILWILNYPKEIKKIFHIKILKIIFLFLTYYLASFLWTDLDIKEGADFSRYILYWSLLFAVVFTFDPTKTQKTISFFLFGILISEIIAYGVFFEIWQFKSATPSNPSPFMFWIDYSIFLSFSALILLNKIISKKYSVKEKVLFFIFFTTITTNLFLSIGRTGQLALFVGIFVLLFLQFSNKLKAVFYSFIISISILFFAYNISSNFQTRITQAITDVKKILKKDLNSSWGIRVGYWIVSYNIIKKNPLFGVGLGDYQEEIKKELSTKKYQFLKKETIKFMKNFHPHNQYLLILLQSGLIGLGMFLYMIFLLFKLPIKDKELKDLQIVFLSIYLVGFFAEPLLIKQFTLVLFVFFNGIFIANSSVKEQISKMA